MGYFLLLENSETDDGGHCTRVTAGIQAEMYVQTSALGQLFEHVKEFWIGDRCSLSAGNEGVSFGP